MIKKYCILEPDFSQTCALWKITKNSFRKHFCVKRNMNGLIFWQKSKNPVLGKILGLFPKARIFLSKNKNKLALSVFDH